jgi:alanyl-tRNA synthetase
MKHRTSDAIREMFLEYFSRRGHKLVASHSLLPPDDPTLLFVNAGMVQFKEMFAGRKTVEGNRAVSSQKCLRVSGKHNDLENVGRTARHHTFFEMLGNFSFGDYFKRDAIHFAWEFLTSDAFMGLPVDQLWVSVYPEDEEAFAIWRDEIGVSEARIVRDPTNFWAMGDTGPCGPCSEIHIDQGKALSGGIEVPFGEGGDRYLELWNLVFMQYERDASGELHPLPKPSIDTGMGLERIAAVVQGKTANYDTDLFRPLIATVEELSSKTYEGRFAAPDERDPESEQDVAFRVLADHARTAAFLIADGIYPENEGRGYVLRRVMRRAIRFGRKLGIEGEFFYRVTDDVVVRMGDVYPELEAARALIERVVRQEEQRFGRTLADGLRLLETEIASVHKAGGARLSGEVAFTLYDTHGFPVDLTRLIAEENGIDVDEAGFEAAMDAQRERGRASWKGVDAEAQAFYKRLEEEGVSTEFVGYGWEVATSEVLAIVSDGRRVSAAHEGAEIEVICATTPFYGEGGGQVGDRGEITGDGGLRVEVTGTWRRGESLLVHAGVVRSGQLQVGAQVELAIDGARRTPTRKNHSATHLMHWALRKVIGNHVKQRGSLVAPDRLRFDFSHFGPLTEDEIAEIERLVNSEVLANHAVQTDELPMDQAMERGAIAFFDEKYGERVRVVAMGHSVELCGGTHVAATGDIGLFKIVSETGISSGVRRIEAVTGMGAVHWVQAMESRLRELGGRLKVNPSEIERRIERMQRELAERDEEIAALRGRLAAAMSGDVMQSVRELGGVKALAVALDGTSGKDLRELGDELLLRLGSGVLLLGSREDDKVSLLVALTPDMTDRFDAGSLVRELAVVIDGKGGGKRHLAQAGGKKPEALDEAIAAFYGLVERTAGNTV